MPRAVHLARPLAVLAMVLLTGGPTPIADAAPPDPRTPPESAPPPGSLLLTDDPLIVHTHPLTIESWSRADTGPSILVHFTSPAPACSGVHAITEESVDAVTVDLRGGWLPEAVGRVCPMIVVRGTLAVPLEHPVGDRRVLSS